MIIMYEDSADYISYKIVWRKGAVTPKVREKTILECVYFLCKVTLCLIPVVVIYFLVMLMLLRYL